MFARDGFQALERIQEANDNASPFDIVFLDWKMPGLDGLQTARKINTELNLDSKPKIVLITAYGIEDIDEDLTDIGVSDVLPKPTSRFAIFQKIVPMH